MEIKAGIVPLAAMHKTFRNAYDHLTAFRTQAGGGRRSSRVFQILSHDAHSWPPGVLITRLSGNTAASSRLLIAKLSLLP